MNFAMALITKMLGVAINDRDAGRITTEQMLSIFQEAIDNGDILEDDNDFYVTVAVIPLVDAGALRSSEHVTTFLKKQNDNAAVFVESLRQKQNERRWWQFWK